MSPWKEGVGISSSPLALGTTQGGIGATHKPQEKISGGIRVPLDPKNNARRYRSISQTPGETAWGY